MQCKPGPPRRGQGRSTGTAADIEQRAIKTGRNAFGQQMFERAEQIVEHMLRRDPAMPRRAIPKFLLLALGHCPIVHSRAFRLPL